MEYVIGAQGGTRTHMVSRTILSRVRLPIPPLGHEKNFKYLYIITEIIKNRNIFY